MISVIVPVRSGGSWKVTEESLERQTYRDFEVCVVRDEQRRGAPWARNHGADLAKGKFLLFSDDDIGWHGDALHVLLWTLLMCDSTAEGMTLGYAYGSYRLLTGTGPGRLIGGEVWNLDLLKRRNYISTMSLMRREVFPGFDESLRRLQDWDLWLGMALRDKVRGVAAGKEIFCTQAGHGISFGVGAQDVWEAERVVRKKWGLE
jgi:glycosyltransferase involved in cell wall biosynthesis